MPLLTFAVEWFFLYSPPIIKISIVSEKEKNDENKEKQIGKLSTKIEATLNKSQIN